jgi:FkbH-like protein
MNVSDYLFPTELRATQTGLQRVHVVGSCLAEGMLEFVRPHCPEVHFDYQAFNNLMELPARAPSEIEDYDFQFVSLSLREIVTDEAVKAFSIGTEAQASQFTLNSLVRLDLALKASLRHAVEHGLLTFVANFCVPQAALASALNRQNSEHDFTALVRRLNVRLAEIVREHRNVYVADVDAIGAALGKFTFQDDVVSFSAHAAFWTARFIEHDTNPAYGAPPSARLDPLPALDTLYTFRVEEYFGAVWRHLESLYRTVHQIDAVKLVIFDLDDTLWRGQIAEHYGDGAVWPQSHGWPVGLWDAIYQLRGRGILTALCSKNDEGLVRERWGRASHWLTIEDFTLRAINWQPKAENIAALMRQASLTPKNVVFVDDNPVEREAVRSAFPAIRIIGANPYLTRRILLWSAETQVAQLSAESVNRDAMMRAQQEREQARAVLSRGAFLEGLGCTVAMSEVHSADDPQFARSLELLNKTNQFNTTGERLSHRDAIAFFAEGGKFHVFTVEDKFTQYGLVGVIRYQNRCFTQFAMSCRVLGLEIETSVIGYILHTTANADANGPFTGRVTPTEANMVSRDVYQKVGFTADRDGTFVLDRISPEPLAPHLTFMPPLPQRSPKRRMWPWSARS